MGMSAFGKPHRQPACPQVGERAPPETFRPDPQVDVQTPFPASQLHPFVHLVG